MLNRAQNDCLSLMAKNVAVSQSTWGDMPDPELDVLNLDGDSLEVPLASSRGSGADFAKLLTREILQESMSS